MVHRLPAVIACVNDNAIASIELVTAGKVGSHRHKMSEQRLMLCHGPGLRGDVFLRDDEEMGGGLWVDIREADAELVFIDTTGRNGTVNDLAEDTVRRHSLLSKTLFID
jgi:hypothetical protein